MATNETSPRIRFNWGFWDGFNDAEKSRLPDWWNTRANHFDRIYVNGYKYGQERYQDNRLINSSDGAWTDYQSVIKEVAAKRKAIKNARPPLFNTRY